MRLRCAALAALTTVALCTAGCAAAHATGAVRVVPEASASASASPPGPAAGIVSQVPGDNPTLTQTGDGTYLSWDVPRTVLARIDTRTGKIDATNTFSQGRVGIPLSADGSVWVTDSDPLGELLLRLDPATLMVTGELALSAARYPDGSHLAYAGGWLWADGGGRLLRVSPSSMELTASIPLRGGDSSDVGASPDGSVLIVSDQGTTGAVQRRDPRTGSLLAASRIGGTRAAAIDGFAGSGVWVTEITGRSARAERLSLSFMEPVTTRPVSGRSDIRVRVAHGLLWVTGGPARAYCADAVTGRALAALPVTGPWQDEMLGVGAGVLYYAQPARHGPGTRIAQVPIPAGCG